MLSKTAQRKQSALAAMLTELESAQLVRRLVEDEPAYIFKHALTQEAAYQSLLQKQRRAIHQRVAETIEQIYSARLDEHAALLAQHYAQAGDDAKTGEYAVRAGDVAARLNAVTEARRHYGDALDALARLPDDNPNRRRRIGILIKQVMVSMFADAPICNLARLDEAEALAKRASESDAGVQRQLMEIYVWKGFINQGNNPRAALRDYNAARVLAQTLADIKWVAWTGFDIGLLLCVQGRFGDAEPLMRDSIDLMRQAQMPLARVSALGNLGWALAAQGRYAEGLAEARRGLAMAQQTNNPGNLETSYSALFQIYLRGGDIPQLLETSRALLATAEQAHDRMFVYVGFLYVALAQSYLGQHPAALANVQKARGIIQMLQGQVPWRELSAAVKAEIVLNAGRIEEAQTLAEQVVQLAQSADSIYAAGLAQRVWGQALAKQTPARWNDIDAHLAESLHLFEEGKARLDAARTHIAWGKILRERGDVETARAHWETAVRQFEASGLARAMEETRALMRGEPSEN